MTTLYYFVDPMCSWCFGFSSEIKKVRSKFPEIQYIMGGLAPDSAIPMTAEIKEYVKHHWHEVATRTGANINFEFWDKHTPTRSTYQACRAVIAAGLQGEENKVVMLEALQKAYYQEARNPTDDHTLIEVAGEIGLDTEQFKDDLYSEQVQELFRQDLGFKNAFGIQGFPTLVMQKDDNFYALTIGYIEAEVVLERAQAVLDGNI